MIDLINEYEERLIDIYEDEIPARSKYFKKTIESFSKTYKLCFKKIQSTTLALSLYNKYNLTRSDMNIIQLLFDNCGVVIEYDNNFYKQINLSRVTVYLRIIFLESENIIKVHRINRVKIIYIHPDILKQWTMNLNQTKP